MHRIKLKISIRKSVRIYLNFFKSIIYTSQNAKRKKNPFTLLLTIRNVLYNHVNSVFVCALNFAAQLI